MLSSTPLVGSNPFQPTSGMYSRSQACEASDRAGASACVAGVNVATDITGGNAEQAGHADEQIGEVLADPSLAGEYLVRRGFQSGAARDILVFAEQREVDGKKRFHQVAVIVFHERHGVVVEFAQLRFR